MELTEEPDHHIWRFESTGVFTSKSAYRALLNGSTTFEPWRRLWKSWAPAKCKVFLWLAIRNKCWTADRLARRGLPHPAQCVFCDQTDEDVQHILTDCVFAREFWVKILTPLGLLDSAPSPNDQVFADWWRKARKRAAKEKRKGLNTLIILGAWMLWKHRNSCVFEGAQPNIHKILSDFRMERQLWHLAGASSLRALGHGVDPD